MSYNLLHDSSSTKLQPDDRGSKSHDFRIYFHPPIVLKPTVRYKAAFDHLHMSYSWYKVSDEYSNNTLRYCKKTGSEETRKVIALPN